MDVTTGLSAPRGGRGDMSYLPADSRSDCALDYDIISKIRARLYLRIHLLYK